MRRSRRESRHGVDSWPAFVDALSTLLLAIIFLLVVFMLGQFFLGQMLEGRDEAVGRLQRLMKDQAGELEVQRDVAADLRRGVQRLNQDLQTAASDRDDLQAQLGKAERERLDREDQLRRLAAERAALDQALEERRTALQAQDRQVAQLQEQLAASQSQQGDDRRRLEASQAELARLREDILALRQVRTDLEARVAGLAAKTEADAQEQLRLLAALGAERDKGKQTLAELEAVQSKTMLAQRELETLTSARAETEASLAAERAAREAASAEARRRAEELEARDARIAELDRARAALEASLATDREATDRVQAEVLRLTAELQTVNARTSVLDQTLAGRASELIEREQRIAELDRNREALESTLAADKAIKDKALTDIQRLTAELQAVNARISVLDQTLAGRASELVAREQRIAELDRGRVALESTLAADKATKDKALTDVQRLTAELQAVIARIATLDQTLAGRANELVARDQRIAEMTRELNQALASRVQELGQFRSEFFGRLRRVLGDREDIRIVGDRFVFQSEVLFASGEAEIAQGGLGEIVKLAQTLRQIASEIPRDLPWVLQVDGHTDRRPIATSRFPSNWELSTARAISVLRALTGQGIPAERLTARGFAEFQPLDTGDNEDAFRRNRRIELKLTTR